MKFTAVILILAFFCHNIHAAYILNSQADVITGFQTQSISDKIKAVFEGLKTIMKTGNSVHGVPVLDPFKFDYKKINLDNEYISLIGSLSDFIVHDLSNYVVHYADFETTNSNLSIDLRWSSIKGKVDYLLDGKVFFFPFYGGGYLRFELKDVKFSVKAKLEVDRKNNKVSVVNFNDVLIFFKKSKMELTGLYYDNEISKLVSARLSDFLPYMVYILEQNVKTELNECLKSKINIILDKISIDDIWSIAEQQF